MLKSGGFERKSKTSSEVPTSSLADIAFLLLIFFMVTTVFRSTQDRPITWPSAEAAERIDEKRENIIHVWVESNGEVWLNDRLTPMDDVRQIVAPLYAQSDRRLVVSIRADVDVAYARVHQLQQQLQRAGAVRVVFATELERRMTRERR